MTWLKIDNRFGQGPAAAIAGDAALGLWLRAGCWLATFPKQGDEIPKYVARHLGKPRQIKALVEVGLWIDRGEYYEMYRGMDVASCGIVADCWQVQLPSQRRAISDTLRSAIYDRDGYACVECEGTDNLSLDHIWPHSRGGEDTLENLQTMCRSCNSKKGARV